MHAPVDIGTESGTMLQMVTLADGTAAALRPARASDVAPLERMYFRLSARSIYFFFFVGAPHVAHWASRFAAVGAPPTPTGMAIVAALGDETIGVARFDVDPSGASAEVGIVVEDAWQGRGLGRYMLRRLAGEALFRHIAIFTARTLGENQRALRLFKGTFAGTQVKFAQGQYAIVAPLRPPPGDSPDHFITAPM